MADSDAGKVRVFISYSHKDEDLKSGLEEHLAMLKRKDLIEVWHDRMIRPGDNWSEEISEELERSHVILLLISSSFLNSDFCYERELLRAIERQDAGHARVIPILVRPCVWQGAPFAKLQGLPRDMNAVTSWHNQDEAWVDVVQGISVAVVQMQSNIPHWSGASAWKQGSGPSMSLRMNASHVSGGTRAYDIEIVADAGPAEGYIGIQTQLHYGSLQYEPVAAKEEIVWPASVFPLRSPGAPTGTEALVSHASASSLIPPFPVSAHVGPLVRLRMRCSESVDHGEHSHDLLLVGYDEAVNTSGSGFKPLNGPAVGRLIRRADVPGLGSVGVAAEMRIVCEPA